MSALIAAIHQPNFFPWLGYFDKIARADVFVVLDDVQYQKTGSSWSNRVKLLVSGEPRWVTAPVSRPAHGLAAINELQWAQGPWREKILRTIALNYGACEHFSTTMALIEPLVMNPQPSVLAYNLEAIRGICGHLDLNDNFVLSSSFALASQSNERLIDLCRKVGADVYLAGGGAAEYQQDELFSRSGIELRYQAFSHPVYNQRNGSTFSPGLSIVDALMNCGADGTRRLLGANR